MYKNLFTIKSKVLSLSVVVERLKSCWIDAVSKRMKPD